MSVIIAPAPVAKFSKIPRAVFPPSDNKIAVQYASVAAEATPYFNSEMLFFISLIEPKLKSPSIPKARVTELLGTFACKLFGVKLVILLVKLVIFAIDDDRLIPSYL